MRFLFKRVLLLSALSFVAGACVKQKTFSLDVVERVGLFPNRIVVSNPDTLRVGVVGIQGIKVFKDVFLLSCRNQEGCFECFTKEGEPLSPPFLKIGRGPGEVLFQPYISWVCFEESESHVLAGLFDFKGNYLEYDLTDLVRGRDTVPSWVCIADSLSVSSGDRFFKFADSGLLCRRTNAFETGFDRFLVKPSGEFYMNKAMHELNSISATEGNILSTIFIINQKEGIVAELGGRMSVIHLYSLPGSFYKTLMVGDGFQDIQSVASLEADNSPKAYYDAHAYDDCFAGLFLGTTIGELDDGTFGCPCIQVFRWDGTPVAVMELPVRSLFFDIDFNDNKLYVVEYESENILRFDIPDLGV